MATDDKQVLVAGQASAPATYTIPGSGQLRPKVIFAKYDGSSATADYVPALKLTSDGGRTVGIFPAFETVTAGASVSVSWFPGVEPDVDVATPEGVTGIASPDSTISVANTSGPTVLVGLPATGVSAGSYGSASDAVVLTADAEGRITAATSTPIAGGGAVTASDGWVPDTTETWTYASFAAGPPALGTFTVSGDVRAKYPVGTKIRLVQTTTKYFVVSVAPTFGGGNTTVSVTGGTDYTLANAAISANYHSYVEGPQGYPPFFNCDMGWTGFSAFTERDAYFTCDGGLVNLFVFVAGTSNATSITAVPPINLAATASINPFQGAARVTDNGVGPTTVGRLVFSSSSALRADKLVNANNGWTGSGTKNFACEFTYLAA